MQIEASVSYHLTSVKSGTIKKTRNTKCQQRCGEKGALCTADRNVISTETTESNQQHSSKIKHKTTYHVINNFTSSYLSEENENTNKRISSPLCLLQHDFSSQDRKVKENVSCLVVSDSSGPWTLIAFRLLCSRNYPGN